MKPRTLVLLSNDKAFRARQSFVELVEAELGESYRFERLGTHLTPEDLAADRPELAWKPVSRDTPVTLDYFMEDYVGHLKHHLNQIFAFD